MIIVVRLQYVAYHLNIEIYDIRYSLSRYFIHLKAANMYPNRILYRVKLIDICVNKMYVLNCVCI